MITNELLKNFKVLIEDLLDNYEKYTDEEKAQVKEIFEKASKLNAILDNTTLKPILIGRSILTQSADISELTDSIYIKIQNKNL